MNTGWSSHPASETMTTARSSEPGESVGDARHQGDRPAEDDEPHEEVDDAGARRLPLGALGGDGVGERPVAASVEPREDTGFQTRNRMTTATARPAKPGTRWMSSWAPR